MKILFEKREPSWDSQERLLSSFEYSQPGGTKGTTGGLRRGSERLINLKVIRPGLPSFPSSCFFFYFFFFFKRDENLSPGLTASTPFHDSSLPLLLCETSSRRSRNVPPPCASLLRVIATLKYRAVSICVTDRDYADRPMGK